MQWPTELSGKIERRCDWNSAENPHCLSDRFVCWLQVMSVSDQAMRPKVMSWGVC